MTHGTPVMSIQFITGVIKERRKQHALSIYWFDSEPLELLDSGQMSQEQLNQLMAMANQFKGMLPK